MTSTYKDPTFHKNDAKVQKQDLTSKDLSPNPDEKEHSVSFGTSNSSINKCLKTNCIVEETLEDELTAIMQRHSKTLWALVDK